MCYQLNSEVRIVDDHIPLITAKDLIRKEMCEIRTYREAKKGDFAEATRRWIEKYEPKFIDEWSPFTMYREEMIQLAREEIAKHRWIESEKCGFDLGIKAELDWIERYSKLFKEYWKNQIRH